MNNENIEESLKARAEARRRRILLNSKARLEKISGQKPNENEEDPSNKEQPIKINNFTEKLIYPDPEVERMEFDDFHDHTETNFSATQHFLENNFFNNPTAFSPTGNPTDFFKTLELNGNLFYSEKSEQEQQQSSTSLPQQTTQSKFQKIQQTKIVIAMLAIFAYILIVTEYLFTSNIFLIFFIWKIPEIVLFKNRQSKRNATSLIGILFLLSGIPPIHSTIFLNFLETIYRIIDDLCIFMFTFVLTHVIWKMVFLNENVAQEMNSMKVDL